MEYQKVHLKLSLNGLMMMAKRDAAIQKVKGVTYYALIPDINIVQKVTINEITERTVLLHNDQWNFPLRYATDDVNFLEIINKEQLT